MADRRKYQTSDHAQTGGGLSPGQDFEDLYTTKPDSHADAGGAAISPNSHERKGEHTRGNK